MAQDNPMIISGSVAPGFESVKALYEQNMQKMAEECSQLCVYYRGEKVVDLYASSVEPQAFTADTLVNVFSSGKSLESVAMTWLASKELIQFDTPIVNYWPEFGAHGKSDVTIADLMRHEAGLANFTQSIDPQDLQTDNLKHNRVGSIIAEEPMQFPTADNRSEYHAVTRGWVANEVYRRVDPQGRTIGEFYREEINPALGVEALIGLNEDEIPRVRPVKHRGLKFEFLESLKPKFLGRRVVLGFARLMGRLLRIFPAIRRAISRRPPVAYKGMDGILFFNERSVTLGQTPSANTKSSARTLAKIAAMMAARGRFDGKEYLSPTAWEAAHADPKAANMGGLMPTRFTQGGVNQFVPCDNTSSAMEREFNEGREGFYGWMGLGGSIFQWHPEKEIGFAFTVTDLHVLDFLNERGKVYQSEVLRCVERLPRP